MCLFIWQNSKVWFGISQLPHGARDSPARAGGRHTIRRRHNNRHHSQVNFSAVHLNMRRRNYYNLQERHQSDKRRHQSDKRRHQSDTRRHQSKQGDDELD